MRLTWTIGTASLLVLLLSLSLLAFLGLHKFEQQLQEVMAARVRVTAVDARRAIENTLGLGLPLTAAQGIQVIVDRAAANGEEIAAVAVIDLDCEPGRLLFSSPPQMSMALARSPEELLRQVRSQQWQWINDRGNHLAGWPLVDPLQRTVGLLAIETRHDRQTRLSTAAGRLVMQAVLLLAALLAMAIAAVMAGVVAPLERSIARARLIVAGKGGDRPQGPLEQLARDFVQATSAAKPADRCRADASAASMNRRTLGDPGRGIVSRTLFAAGAIMLLAALSLAVYSAYVFEQRLAPEIEAKSLAVARSLQGDIEHAVGYGIPLDSLQGMDELLDEVLAEHAELARISVVTPTGSTLYQRSRPGAAGNTRNLSLPLADGSAAVVLAIQADYARNQLLGIFADAAIILLVTLLLALELLPLMVNRLLGEPLESVVGVMRAAATGNLSWRVASGASGQLGRLIKACNRRLDHASRLTPPGDRVGNAAAGTTVPYRAVATTDIRAPMFVFVLAEELSRAFLPLYVRDLYAPIPGLSQQAAIGLPITVFMLFVALGTLFAGGQVRRMGSVRLFRWGVGLAAAGFAGLALANNLYDLLLWRTLTAIGYALGTLACQAHVAEMTTADRRTQAMSVFVGAVMVAAVCGSAIGGVLADLIGYRGVFWGSLGLVLLSWLIFPHTGRRDAAESPPVGEAAAGIADYRVLLADRGFMTVMLLGAIPAKLILTGSLFLIVPLYLAQLGADTASIGRTLMLYYLLMAFGNPLSAYLADRFGLGLSLVAGGAAIAGIGSLSVLLLDGTPALLLAVVALGLGQMLATAPTFSLALAAGHGSVESLGQASVLAAMRVIERAGSVAGPLLAGTLVSQLGYQPALAIIGGVVLGCAAALPLLLRRNSAGVTL